MFSLKEQIDSDLNFRPQTRSPQQLQNQNELFDEEKEKIVKYYGKYITCWRNSNGQPRILLGPHFYIFIIALLICCCLLVLLLYSLKDILNLFWFFVLVGCSIGFALSYILVGVSNPGIISATQQPSFQIKNDPKYCKKCKIIKSKEDCVYHCEYCDVCIQGFDHHCPWIGKCVGKKNLFFFYFFLAMTFGTLIMCFVATIASGGGKASFHRRSSGNQKIIKQL